MHQDPFCVTFGKENWNTLQIQKNNNDHSVSTPLKKHPHKQQNETKYHTARTHFETENRKTIKKKDLYKQNNFFNEQTAYKNQRRYSTIDRNQKHSQNLNSLRQQIAKQQQNYPVLNMANKEHISFDLELKRKLLDMETASKYNTQKYRILSQNRPIESIYDPYVSRDKYKLIKPQTVRKQRATAVQPSMNRYKEQINKIDTLINRINDRIKSSHVKYC